MGRGARRLIPVLAFALLALPACSQPGEPTGPPPATPPASASPSRSPMPPASPASPQSPASPPVSPSGAPSSPTSSDAPAGVSPARWAAVLADLKGRGVDTAGVRLVSAQLVTWPTGALGCPRPGMVYTQAQVRGQRVVVEASGRPYDYRFGTNDIAVLCESGAVETANPNA